MKHIKLYENYIGISSTEYTEEKKKHLFCVKCVYGEFKINDNGSIDVFGNVDLEGKINTEIPYKFNKVSGNFKCDRSGLKNLKNCPEYVGGDFRCYHNYLTTLSEGPKIVNGLYCCQNNLLRDVYGFPNAFEGILYINQDQSTFDNDNISNNFVTEILNIVIKDKKIRFIKLLNEYQVIRNQMNIIENRLLDVLSEIGESSPKNLNFENYKLI